MQVDTFTPPPDEISTLNLLFTSLDEASKADSRGAMFIDKFAECSRQLIMTFFEKFLEQQISSASVKNLLTLS